MRRHRGKPGAAHFQADSEGARVLPFFGPAGVEGFFREAATEARSLDLPPADEPAPDREQLVEIMSRHGQTGLGPPLTPKDSVERPSAAGVKSSSHARA
jgi:hypothetical protein